MCVCSTLETCVSAEHHVRHGLHRTAGEKTRFPALVHSGDHLFALERARAKVLDGLLGLRHHDGLCGHAEARAAGGAKDGIGGAERRHEGRGLRNGGSLPDNVAQIITGC